MRFVVIGLLMQVCWGSVAVAAPSRQSVLDLLNAYEHVPSEQDLKALGDGVDAELIAVAQDAAVPHSRRGRAVSALGHLPGDRSKAFLSETLGSASADALLRRKAAGALVLVDPAAAVAPLVGALGDSDPELRSAVVYALGSVKDDAAKKALSDRKAVESDERVKKALDTVLGGR
jgi:HEAT repeat protein